MLEFRTDPTPREQRQFVGIWLPAMAVLLGAIAYWRFQAAWLGMAIWGVGGVATAVGIMFPRSRRPLWIAWMGAVFPIGWVVSHVALVLVYYLVMTPIGLALRLSGHDPLQRRFDRESPTYWKERTDVRSPRDYLRQF